MAKSKYEKWLLPEKLILLEGWARDGLTDEQIAQNMGICRDTLIEWKKKYSDISDTIKKGKEVVDFEVENALLKRALGYNATEIKTKTINGEIAEQTITVKNIPPDTGAAVFWLKNRRPDKWRENVIPDDSAALDRLDQVLKEVRENAKKSGL